MRVTVILVLRLGKKTIAFCVAKGIGVSNSTKGEVKVKSEKRN